MAHKTLIFRCIIFRCPFVHITVYSYYFCDDFFNLDDFLNGTIIFTMFCGSTFSWDTFLLGNIIRLRSSSTFPTTLDMFRHNFFNPTLNFTTTLPVGQKSYWENLVSDINLATFYNIPCPQRFGITEKWGSETKGTVIHFGIWVPHISTCNNENTPTRNAG